MYKHIPIVEVKSIFGANYLEKASSILVVYVGRTRKSLKNNILYPKFKIVLIDRSGRPIELRVLDNRFYSRRASAYIIDEFREDRVIELIKSIIGEDSEGVSDVLRKTYLVHS